MIHDILSKTWRVGQLTDEQKMQIDEITGQNIFFNKLTRPFSFTRGAENNVVEQE